MDEAVFWTDLHADLERNEALKSESFYGVYHFLVREEVKDQQEGDRVGKPIVFIIKNIKTFPQNVLNELIHLIQKYR